MTRALLKTLLLALVALPGAASAAETAETAEAAVPTVAPEQPVRPKIDSPAAVATPTLTVDELPNAGYVPGYRSYQSLSLTPYSPRSQATPGGITPGFGAPMPPTSWTLRYTGFLSATLQTSVADRPSPLTGQSKLVFHIPHQTIDEYGSFLGTSTAPGQWVAMNFAYGNNTVSANVSINSWNPTEPTTYYQIGGQLFINYAYLDYTIPPLGPLQIKISAGYVQSYYGALGDYGLGMYTNAIVALLRGVGEVTRVEYALRPTLTVFAEHGFLGNRNGHVSNGVVANAPNNWANPIFAASWVHHAHLGLQWRGEYEFRTAVHYLSNWAQDDRARQPVDNPFSRAIDETAIKDGHIDVLGWDARLLMGSRGALGLAASYNRGENIYPLRGLVTFGGEGQSLTDKWFGPGTGGTGTLYVAGLNYGVSIGRLLQQGLVPLVATLAAGVLAHYLTTTHDHEDALRP